MNIKATIQKLILSATENVLKITTTENKLNLKVFDGIPEAPNDGRQYGRKSKQWQEIEGGAIDIDDTVTEMSQNAVKSSGIWTAINNLWQSFSGALSNVSDSISNHINAKNDAHPAKAITVSDQVTPDYTAPEVGDTMQDITNKVAGLQFTKIVEINLSEDVTQIIETFDRSYNELIIYTELTFKDINNDPLASRANYTFNNVDDNIYSWGTFLDFSFFRTLNTNANKEVAIIHVKANVNNNFVGTTISARDAMSIYGVGFNSFSSIQIRAITTFISNNSKLTIYGR